MDTKVWKVDKTVDDLYTNPQIREAAEWIKKNECVAFPTETVYGLGANAKRSEAVKKIFFAKGRPSDNPLIIHIAGREDVDSIAESVPEKAKQLMEQFWPGPLTIILRKKPGVLADEATAGLPTVGIRMPDHPVALALIRASGLPIAAPSANRSGRPSPTSANHVLEDLQGKIAGVIDGGETGVGVESTVIDCTVEPPILFRPGGVTREAIESVIGKVELATSVARSGEKPRSPGMKYTHYAPKGTLYLVEGSPAFIQHLVDERRSAGMRVGVLTTEEHRQEYSADCIISCGTRKDLTTVARHLFESLRQFDREGVEIIFGETFPQKEIGLAIMNRLMKAAGHRLIREE
jgi:translation factor SUA5